MKRFHRDILFYLVENPHIAMAVSGTVNPQVDDSIIECFANMTNCENDMKHAVEWYWGEADHLVSEIQKYDRQIDIYMQQRNSGS